MIPNLNVEDIVVPMKGPRLSMLAFSFREILSDGKGGLGLSF